MAALAELTAYLATRVADCDATPELAELTLRFWPEYRLNPAKLAPLVRTEAIRKARAITRARVQETFEARRPTDAWTAEHQATQAATFDVVLELWLTGPAYRAAILQAQAEALARRSPGPTGAA